MPSPRPSPRPRWRAAATWLAPVVAIAATLAWRARSTPGGDAAASLRALPWPFTVATSFAAPACDALASDARVVQCAGQGVDARTAATLASLATAVPRSGSAREMQAEVDLWYAATDAAARRRATRTLEARLARGAGDSVALMLDLAAARLFEDDTLRATASRLAALDLASAALRRIPQHTAAAWNRRLALRWLGIGVPPSPGTAAWSDATRAHLWREVLPAWARATLDGDTAGTAAAMTQVRAMARGANDSVARELPTAVLPLLATTGVLPARQELARGVLAMAALRTAAAHADWDAVARELAVMQRQPAFMARFGGWVQYEQGSQALQVGRIDEARRAFDVLLRNDGAGGGYVARRAAWGMALADLVQGRQAEVVRRLQGLVRDCRAAREEECVASASATLATALSDLGQDDAATVVLGDALAFTARAPVSVARWSLLEIVRSMADRRALPDAHDAIAAEQRTVAAALQRMDLRMAGAFAAAERALGRGQLAEARAAVADMVRTWSTEASPSEREEYRFDVLWIRGELARRQGDRASVALLDSAVQVAERTGNIARSFEIRLSLARARLAHGDTVVALVALDSLLQESRARGGGDAGVLEHTRLADALAGAATDAARALLARGEAVRALRALSAKRFAAAGVLPALAAGVRAVALRQVGDSLVRWDVQDGAVRASVVPLPARALPALAASLDSAASVRLYSVLVPPAVRGGDMTVLRIDARGAAAGIAWAALRDSVTGRHLIEQVELVHVPDITVAPPGGRGDAATRVLLVDAAVRRGPRALPGAAAEVDSLRRLWGPRATVVPGTSVRAWRGAAIVHFAGHALLDDAAAERSGLLVPTATGDSLVSAAAMAQWRLPRTALVVLAACETRAARPSTMGGLESVAGVLRSVGAGAVIGAGWPVADAPTAALMLELHRQLRDGHQPAAALRAAQLSMLRSADPARRAPRAWAAFQLLGR